MEAAYQLTFDVVYFYQTRVFSGGFETDVGLLFEGIGIDDNRQRGGLAGFALSVPGGG